MLLFREYLREDVELGGRDALLGADRSTGGHDAIHLLRPVQVGHVSGVQDVVDVFQHALVDNLHAERAKFEQLDPYIVYVFTVCDEAIRFASIHLDLRYRFLFPLATVLRFGSNILTAAQMAPTTTPVSDLFPAVTSDFLE